MELSQEQLKELARKYLKGEATEEEQRQLHGWYESVNAGELEVVISELPEDIASYRDGAWREMRERIAAGTGAIIPSEDEQMRDGDVRRILPWRRIGVAACFALLLGLAARWYYHRPVSATGTVPAVVYAEVQRTDAAPGGNKAVLTLDDGRSIVLDSAGKGSLAMQGNMQVVKLEDGKIAYRKNGVSDGAGNQGAAGTAAISYNVMSTPRGGQYQLTLPDGTKVWLNAASSIRYPTAFTGRERRVEVRGEAYFEVSSNPNQPFVVDVNKKQIIEVLGTYFNVNAYEDEASIRTTLLNGRVRVNGEGGGVKRVLLPGQQAQLDRNGGLVLIEHPNMDATMAWKNGIFSFDHSDIQSVMRELARWYDMDVEFRGTPTSDVFGGDIRRNLPLSKVFRILEKSQVHFNIEHGKIIVMP